MSAVADFPVNKQRHPVPTEALRLSPDTQFPCNKRTLGSGCSAISGINRGHAILGGSPECIAVYPGDSVIALSALDASFNALSPRGTRTISIHDLHVELGSHPEVKTVLAPDELIVRTRIPVRGAYHASAY
jgi:xanthine dehydrogenase YagS FAD-binding subunit